MTSDPRTALVAIAVPLLALILYILRALNVPEDILPTVAALLGGCGRLAEIWYDNQNKAKAAPS